jgi:hypothetical protein
LCDARPKWISTRTKGWCYVDFWMMPENCIKPQQCSSLRTGKNWKRHVLEIWINAAKRFFRTEGNSFRNFWRCTLRPEVFKNQQNRSCTLMWETCLNLFAVKWIVCSSNFNPILRISCDISDLLKHCPPRLIFFLIIKVY